MIRTNLKQYQIDNTDKYRANIFTASNSELQKRLLCGQTANPLKSSAQSFQTYHTNSTPLHSTPLHSLYSTLLYSSITLRRVAQEMHFRIVELVCPSAMEYGLEKLQSRLICTFTACEYNY